MNKRLPLFLFFNAFAATLYAQSDSLVNRNIKALENYAMAKPIEKVHLHLDRPVYFPGDTIWFQSYVVLGAYHKLSALSGILYAELIDPKDSVIKRLTLGLQAGTAPGDFELPFNMAPGMYRIRAYTAWMRNFGSEYFFDQPITVAGFSKAADPVEVTAVKARGSATPDKVDLQFFPEGGDLVNGLRSKVAFKAITQNGMAEEVQGSIMDNAGNEVATFTTRHLGMGAFPLEPQKGKNYFAKVTAADGSIFNVPLPAATDAGFTLSVNNIAGDSLYLKVAAANLPDTAFYLIAQSEGKHYFAAARKLQDKVFTASIPKNRFPTGIVQFTLFSQSGEPINERIVFIQNDDQLKLTITPDKRNYAPGEKVKLTMQATEPDGTPATGTFSVSVIDESKVPVNEAAENTIFTDLLLKSEISGCIQDPNYYFMELTDKTKTDLDLLMLTQGYRRFEWKKLLSADTTLLAFQPEDGFAVSGTVTTPAGKPIPNGKVILTSIRNLLAMDTLTDLNGRFAFSNIVLRDTATLVINAKKANGGNNVLVKMDKPAYAPVTKMTSQPTDYIASHFSLTPKQVQQAYAAWRQDSVGHVIQLKEVTVKDHKTRSIHPDYSQVLKYSANLNGPGNANQVLMAGDDFLKYSSLADALYGKAQGVEIGYKPPGRKAYSLRAKMRHLSGPLKPMAIYVNGTQVQPDYLEIINPADVYSVEILLSAQYLNIYGTDASNGALIVTLKNGNQILNQTGLVRGIITYEFKGFYKAREFYSPKYEVDVNANSLQDMRATKLWQPDLFIKKEVGASFDIYNSNHGNFRIVVEGIGNNGNIGRKSYYYKVQ